MATDYYCPSCGLRYRKATKMDAWICVFCRQVMEEDINLREEGGESKE